jgi:ubiquitin carboxyl-terminal hydrolase 7
MAAKVGAKLNVDPFKIRFLLNPTGGDVPKTVIKRVANQSIHEIIQSSYYTPTVQPVFWYEFMEVSVLELETKRNIKVILLDPHVREMVCTSSVWLT